MRFKPNYKSTIAYTANAVSQNSALPVGGGLMLRLQNAGPQIAFVEFTADANLPVGVAGSSAGGFPVFANQPALDVALVAGQTNIAFISAGNSTLYVTRGDLI